MKEYFVQNGRIKFFSKEKSRIRHTRLRWSYLYSKQARENKHLPFRVENYFGPAFFYNGLMNDRKNVDYGYLVVKRGIGRNLYSKGE